MADVPTQLKIFVSHSSFDKATCDTIVTTLRRAGADVWYDEHNLGAGQLLEVIQRELQARLVFVVLLSKNAFASQWVRRETTWAFNLANREPDRLILPITVEAIEPSDFNGSWLFLEDYKRVEARGMQPLPTTEMIGQTLHLLALTAKGAAPVAVTPQPSESLSDLLTQGKALFAQKQYAEALPYFQRAALSGPNSFDAWANLGSTLNWLERWEEALPAHERATDLGETRAFAWNSKGNALRHLGRFVEALEAYKRALDIDPTYARAWNNTGIILNHQKLYEEALEVCNRALAIDPSFADAWKNKGNALDGMERYGEALDAYVKATTCDPAFALAWNGKGNALKNLGRHQEAIQAYDMALTLRETPRFWENKTESLRALGRTAEAEAAERRAKALRGMQ